MVSFKGVAKGEGVANEKDMSSQHLGSLEEAVLECFCNKLASLVLGLRGEGDKVFKKQLLPSFRESWLWA